VSGVREKKRPTRGSPALRAALSMLLALLVASPLLAAAQAYDAKTTRDDRVEIQNAAALAGIEWERYVQERAQSLRQLASFWENSDVVELGEFRSFSTPILTDLPGIVRITVLTPEMNVRWTMPPSPLAEEAGAPADPSWGPALQTASEEATKTRDRRIVLSELIALSSGGMGYIMVGSVHGKPAPHAVQGYAVAELALGPTNVFSAGLLSSFALVVRDGTDVALATVELPPANAISAFRSIGLPGSVRGLSPEPAVLTAWPTAAHAQEQREEHLVSRILSSAGLVLGLFVGAFGWRETGRAWERRRDAARLHETNHELAAKVRELDSFSHVVAHDLKGPLRGIAAAASALEEEHGTALAPDARADVQRIRSSAEHMGEMVEALLAYALAGGRRYAFEETATGAVVAQALANLSSLLSSRSVDVEVSPSLPVVAVQRAPLEQVFMNLVSNAVTHNPSERPRVRIDAHARDGGWEFSVEDNGAGVPAHERGRIFELFRRGSRALPGTGTGVGLATVKRLVEGQGGRIWVEDAPAGGAVFRFTIPQRAASAGDEA